MEENRQASSGGRQQYVQELSEKMGEWDEKVEQITSKSSRGSMDSVLLDDLLQKQAAAHEWLNECKEADDEMWEELKAQASVASQSYQDTLERAAERFKVEGPRHASKESQRQEGGSEATEAQGEESSEMGQDEEMQNNESENERAATGGSGGGSAPVESQ